MHDDDQPRYSLVWNFRSDVFDLKEVAASNDDYIERSSDRVIQFLIIHGYAYTRVLEN